MANIAAVCMDDRMKLSTPIVVRNKVKYDDVECDKQISSPIVVWSESEMI